jgi:hypothetical protein
MAKKLRVSFKPINSTPVYLISEKGQKLKRVNEFLGRVQEELDKPAGKYLDKTDWEILELLGSLKEYEYFYQDDLAHEVCISRRNLVPRLVRLKKLGYVAPPEGRKQGLCITLGGLAVLERPPHQQAKKTK